MIPADYAAELALIEMSRLQREVLDRWMVVCADAGEIETAEEIRQIAVTETQEEIRRAA
jgi:hypothetical protein